MREIFKRLEEDVLIKTEVDIDASDSKKSSAWLFSVFIKFDGFDESVEGFEEFLETKESLIIALEHDNRAKFVGHRVNDGWSELYFYAKTSKHLDAIVSKILTPSDYIYESNVVRDTRWDFYETQLYPTELEFCHIQSDKIISLLEEEEDDLNIDRVVEHYIVFDTNTQKERFISNIETENFEYKDDISSENYEHGVALSKKHKVTEDEVREVIEQLFIEIKKEHGYYEGWSTVLARDICDKEKI